MSIDVARELTELAETVEARAAPHDCAGFHCSRCLPAETSERLTQIAEAVGVPAAVEVYINPHGGWELRGPFGVTWVTTPELLGPRIMGLCKGQGAQ